MDPKIKLSDLRKRVFLLKPNIYIKLLEPSMVPFLVTKVTPADLGLRLKSIVEFCPPYLSVNYISVFSIHEAVNSSLFIDVYFAEQPRYFRIPIESISYDNFFTELNVKNINEKFRLFVLNLLKKSAPVFIDEPTGSYLKNNNPWIYNNSDEANIYSSSVWPQIMYRKKNRCETCFEIYWEDIRNRTSKKYCLTCRTEKIPATNISVAFIKHLIRAGHQGQILVDKFEKLMKFELLLNGVSIADANLDQISDFVSRLKMSGLKPEEIESYRFLIKEFYNFCISSGYRKRNLQHVVNDTFEYKIDGAVQTGSVNKKNENENREIYSISSFSRPEKAFTISEQPADEIIQPDQLDSRKKVENLPKTNHDRCYTSPESQFNGLKKPGILRRKNPGIMDRIRTLDMKQFFGYNLKILISNIYLILKKSHLL
ncbi:MAG: hypothetical protein A2161_10165 [Candidatus Schekmanbacteria bacterium RBG_13_48_7]|uniref:Uncharacterized protein n=1 Tax=Candidatus Schekmanbacteria bacterium RBG_13_48_7 TaxID=1817878 RepID=A0A1F7S0Q8_9BACT|nr:MAG: hypothetical protein A2161_10165 [Candidatus Schekmanbacteria bacterium RBG_13_48_7]